MDNTSITVSIVTYMTDLEELKKCLESLSSSIVKKIYIIDNSQQKYIEKFCLKYYNIDYIASKNVGYGAGHNKAIKLVMETDVKYHLVLNSDVYFEPSVLEKITEYMELNKDVSMVQPNIIYPNGDAQNTCRLLPSPANLIFRRFLPKRIMKSMDERYTLSFWNHKKELNIPYHQGSFLFIRKSCFKDVGLFDERFFMYPEDIDITRRMHTKSRTMFWPGVTIIHAHRAASYKSKKMLKIHIVNMIKYFNKWGWIFDSQRRIWNKEVLNELGYNKK